MGNRYEHFCNLSNNTFFRLTVISSRQKFGIKGLLFILAKMIALDLVILLGSATPKVFAEQKHFVISLLDKITISEDAALVAAVLYGNPPHIKWRFGDMTTSGTTKRATFALQSPGINGDLYQALNLINDTILTARSGARARTPKTILMFVDDNPIAQKARMDQLAKLLKDRNVKLVIVNTGRKDDNTTLQAFAYDAFSYFFPPKLEELKRMLEPVFIAVLPGLIFSHLITSQVNQNMNRLAVKYFD